MQSYICETKIVGKKIHLSGYAISGGGKKVVSVEISKDGGNTWSTANLEDESGQTWENSYAWVFWSLCLEYTKGDNYICRAIDELNTIQNTSIGNNWNIRGILNNSPHKI